MTTQTLFPTKDSLFYQSLETAKALYPAVEENFFYRAVPNTTEPVVSTLVRVPDYQYASYLSSRSCERAKRMVGLALHCKSSGIDYRDLLELYSSILGFGLELHHSVAAINLYSGYPFVSEHTNFVREQVNVHRLGCLETMTPMVEPGMLYLWAMDLWAKELIAACVFVDSFYPHLPCAFKSHPNHLSVHLATDSYLLLKSEPSLCGLDLLGNLTPEKLSLSLTMVRSSSACSIVRTIEHLACLSLF